MPNQRPTVEALAEKTNSIRFQPDQKGTTAQALFKYLSDLMNAENKKGTRWMPENLVAGVGFEPTASGL